MKKLVLFIIGKFLLYISPLLWYIPTKQTFRLHQYIGNTIIRWHHKYKINILN